MRLKRIGEWVEYHGNGKTFYYKESTGEFMYERPIDMVRGNRTYRVDFALIYNRFPLFYLFAFGTAC